MHTVYNNDYCSTVHLCVDSYGTCKESDVYCFGRLPLKLSEANSELLAVDSAGNVYR